VAKALEYAERAGARADALYARPGRRAVRAGNRSARQQLSAAPRLHRARGLANERSATSIWRAPTTRPPGGRTGDGDRRPSGRPCWTSVLWSGRDYDQTRAYFRRCTRPGTHARRSTALAHSLNGSALVRQYGQPAEGERLHREALVIFERVEDGRGSPRRSTSWAWQLRAGQPGGRGRYLDRAIALFVARRSGSLTSAWPTEQSA